MESFLKFLQGFGVSPGAFLAVVVFGGVIGFSLAFPAFSWVILTWALGAGPVWVPVALAVAMWKTWIWYIRALYIASQKYSLLEIRIPREVEKSPRAMELFLTGIYIGSGEATFIQRWWKGQVRPWWSLELASFGGEIHFFIWTRSFFRDIVEAQLYAQFPEIEIYEVEDYAARFHYDPDAYSVWGCDFKKSGKDVYPIKTYVDMQLDKSIEEGAVDPLAQIMEFLSSLKQGEQIWLQILVRQDKDKRRKPGTFFEKEDRWKAEAKEEIKAIRDRTLTKYVDESGKERAGFPNPTPGDTMAIKAIETAQGKQPFDVGIRGIYIAQKDSFRAVNITALIGVWRHFGYFGGGGLSAARWLFGFDYPWEDYKNIRKDRMRTRVIDAFRRRSWFHPPYRTPHYVMNTEELATIFRFPPAEVRSPGLRRTPATKAEPPPNLPL